MHWFEQIFKKANMDPFTLQVTQSCLLTCWLLKVARSWDQKPGASHSVWQITSTSVQLDWQKARSLFSPPSQHLNKSFGQTSALQTSCHFRLWSFLFSCQFFKRKSYETLTFVTAQVIILDTIDLYHIKI